MAEKTPKGRRRNTGSPSSVTELKQKEQRSRGAETLLKNKLLTNALDDMKQASFELIGKSAMDEKGKREDLYNFIKAIEGLEKQLKIYFNQGRNAAVKLEVITNVNRT